MATSTQLSGGGVRLPAIDTTLTKPMDVLGAVASGVAIGDLVSDIPNKVRQRKINTKQQEAVLADEFKAEGATIGPDGQVTTKLQDPLAFELARALDSAKVSTENLQGANYQSQIDRRGALLPGEINVLSSRAGELQARSNAILSPEVVETVTPSGEIIQVVTGPTGAREVNKTTGARTATGEIPTVGTKILNEAGQETGYVYGPEGKPMLDKSFSPPKTEAESLNLTPAEKAVDTKFAADYAEFVLGGGFAGTQKQIEQVQEAIDQLDTVQASGPVFGRLPQVAKDIISPQGISIREQIEQSVQQTLRQTLGAQFTENEGQGILSRTFNPNLPEAENKKRAERLLTELSKIGEAKQQAAEYFQKNGTLKGYKGSTDFTLGGTKVDITAGMSEQAIRATVAQAKEMGLNLNPGTYNVRGTTVIIEPEQAKLD